MTETKQETPRVGPVKPGWITELLVAAFSAEVPPVVLQLVDPELCARFLDGSKLGIVSGPAGTGVRIAHDGESERLIAEVSKAFPAVKAWLAAQAGNDVLFEVVGEGLRIYVYGAESGGGAVGVWWQDGQSGTIHPGAAPGGVPAGGEWVELRGIGPARALGVYGAEASDEIAKRGNAAIGATVAHYKAAGIEVAPWSIEVGPEGETLCAWGAHARLDAASVPEVLLRGTPSADDFANTVVPMVDEDHAAAARTLIIERLYPSLVALQPDGVAAGPFFGQAWTFVIGSMSAVVPTQRLLVIEQIAVANRLSRVQDEAYQLAAARYIAAHPEATVPADLASHLVGATEAAVRELAEKLRVEHDALQAVADADADRDVHRMVLVPYDAEVTEDLLNRAITGEFHGAQGPLHDYLVGLGTLGYDDDPSMIALEDVDLEPQDRDAALEEALAREGIEPKS